jgi:hypothetical protein
MCTFSMPFVARNIIGLIMKIIQHESFPLPKGYSDQMVDLIKRLITKDENVRPAVAEVLKE